MKIYRCGQFFGFSVLLLSLTAVSGRAQRLPSVTQSGRMVASIEHSLPKFMSRNVPEILSVERMIRLSSWRAPLLLPQLERSLVREVRPPLRPEVHNFTVEALNNEAFIHSLQRNFQPVSQISFPGKKQIDAVIFDMDGTLLDSLPAWENSASNFLRSQGIEPPANFDQEIAQLSLLDGARIIKERYGFTQSPEEILALTLEPIRHHYLTDIEAKPGAVNILKELHRQGIKISVATASDKELAQRAFERLGMMQYIDFIITCDEVGAGKHSPAVYDAAREHLGTAKHRTLVVEDALHAVQTAKKAGYPVAGVEDSFHSAEHNQAVRRSSLLYIESFDKSIPLMH